MNKLYKKAFYSYGINANILYLGFISGNDPDVNFLPNNIENMFTIIFWGLGFQKRGFKTFIYFV